MTFTRPTILLLIAVACFVIGWIIALGANLIGTDTEWLFAGLAAFAAAHLP